MTKEQKFFNALRDVFIGAEVEGESGYINLMRIKSRYYTEGVFPKLQQDINKALKPFPGFRDELFEKLHDFFHRYFSESGSIYFRYTALHQNVYEKVYTNDKDVMLFWKTHMLYYVKTDRLFKSMEVMADGGKFFFDVATIEHKKANENRDIVYTFKERRKDGTLVFTVAYSKKGKKTRTDDILKTLRKYGEKINEEILERAFRVFEKQSEVDYFINKDAKAFLEEQFNLWIYQYVFSGVSEWTETRIKQLQILREVAFNIIAFISQFENELVKIWNKPKFALNSNYLITLDRIFEKEGGIGLVEKLLAHKNFQAQVKEWQRLGIVDASFKKTAVMEKGDKFNRLARPYQYLPIDTKHFKDVELEILGLFDKLDASLDGWLIKSENYQALNTLLPKFLERVPVIYIDPPYNTDASAIIYANNYKDSSWLTLMENRINLAKSFLTSDGVLSVAIDDEEALNLRFLLTTFFPEELGIIAVRSNPAGRKTKGKFSPAHEYAMFYGKSEESSPMHLHVTEKRLARFPKKDEIGNFAWANFIRSGSNDKREDRPKLFYPIFVSNDDEIRIPQLRWDSQSQSYILLEQARDNEAVVYPIVKQLNTLVEKNWQRGHIRVANELGDYRIRRSVNGEISIDFKTYLDEQSLPTTWWDNREYASANYGAAELKALFGKKTFDFSKSVRLVKDCITVSGGRFKSAIILDFFAGSGTTAQAVINLNREDGGRRKYILVEMDEHFDTVILPRIKKVAFSDKWKDGKAQGGGKGISHFCKYCQLEQYEDALRRTKHADADLFDDPNKDPYHQYVFLRDLKMLGALEVDTKKNKVKVDLNKVYDGIDIPETLSNLAGKWIKRITADSVEFEDGEVVDTKNLDWRRIKPLIWW